MLVIKLRGDGRAYLLNIASEGQFDIWWNDIFHYILYTRGGPHWQIAKVKFYNFNDVGKCSPKTKKKFCKNFVTTYRLEIVFSSLFWAASLSR